MKTASVILLSGGLDSSANLAICEEKDEPVLALTVNYGQRAALQEIKHAALLCAYYGIKHQILDLTWLGSLGGSSLTEKSRSVPKLKTSELDDLGVIRGTARSVWVPNRNGVLINAAAAFAETLGAKRVVVGFNLEEATTFPDNSAEFLARSSRTLAMSTANQVEIFCYTTELNKTEIVRELGRLKRPFPFDRLWSCYHGGEKACGECESCQRLARALGSQS